VLTYDSHANKAPSIEIELREITPINKNVDKFDLNNLRNLHEQQLGENSLQYHK
jgi:hypothetical protein